MKRTFWILTASLCLAASSAPGQEGAKDEQFLEAVARNAAKAREQKEQAEVEYARARLALELRDAENFANIHGTFNDSTLGLYTVTQSNLLGVEVASVDEALRHQLGLEENTGAVVVFVQPESNAAKAGVQQHDIALTLGGKKIGDSESLRQASEELAGKEAKITLLRKAKPLELMLMVPKQPEYKLARVRLATSPEVEAPRYRLGLHLSEADDTLRSQLRLAAGEGLVITELVPESPAAEVGLQPHDVLTKLDGKRLTTVENINTLIQEIKDRKVGITFYRNGQEMSLQIAPKLGTEPLASVEWNNLLIQRLTDEGTVQLGGHKLARIAWATRAEMQDDHSVAAQIARLKEQLAEMQTVVDQLSTAIESTGAKQPEATPEKNEVRSIEKVEEKK